MEIRKVSKTNLSMSIFEFGAFLGICKQMVKTTHEFLIKSIKHLLHFSVPTQNTMNTKITSILNLAEKLKKLGSRQETVLAGVADHLTEEEKTNINLTLNKMDQLSNNIRVEEDKPPTKTLQRNQILRLSSYHSRTIFVHLRSQTKWTVCCFPQWTDLYQSFNA